MATMGAWHRKAHTLQPGAQGSLRLLTGPVHAANEAGWAWPTTVDTLHSSHSLAPRLAPSPHPHGKHQHIPQILAKLCLLRKASYPTKWPGQVSLGR